MSPWWTNLALRTKGLIVIAIPCVILLGVIVAVYAADAAGQRTDAVVAHSTRVRTGIERTLALMDRAETSVRSYLLVPRREFLADYARARQQVLNTIEQLDVLLEGDVEQTARLRSVEALVVDRLKALDIAGRIPDADGQLRERSLRTGQAVLESLRGTLGLMQEEAEAGLAQQTAAAARQAAMVRWLLFIGGITGIGGGILAATLFTTGLGDRMRRLGDAADEISHGAYDTRLPAAEDEIGALADRLHDAARRLEEREQQLRTARDDADAANRAKSEFLSRMSHELRTPMNSILGFGQLLQMERLSAEDVDSVDQIMRGGRHLLRLINEVLEVSRIEAGTISLSPEPVHAGDVVLESIDLVLPLAAGRRVTISAHERDFEGVYVRADRQRLAQVLLNLLSNAVKYNRPGGRVDVTTGTGYQMLRIAVHDTGPGIAAADLDRVFEPFERLGAASTGVEGTGLGLSIARRLAEAMGGRVGVDSVVGRGSVFWVELPLTTPPEQIGSDAAEPLPEAAAKTAVAARRVLYIEDNVANLRLMERIVGTRPGLLLLPAMQGGLGVELARNHQPHLVLLDLNLPDMHGTEVLRRLRQDPQTTHIPVVVISADATTVQIERLTAIGAEAYLTKPLDIRELITTMDRLLGARRAANHEGREDAASKVTKTTKVEPSGRLRPS